MMNLHQNDVKRRKRHRHSKNVQHPRKRRAKFPFSEYSHIRKTNYFRSTIPNYILPHANVLTSTLRSLLVLPYSFRIDSPHLFPPFPLITSSPHFFPPLPLITTYILFPPLPLTTIYLLFPPLSASPVLLLPIPTLSSSHKHDSHKPLLCQSK